MGRHAPAVARRSRPTPAIRPTELASPKLLSIPEFVPPNFHCGVEILNDNATPMKFVVEILQVELKLAHAEAITAMLDIHKRGGRLFPTASLADAQRITENIRGLRRPWSFAGMQSRKHLIVDSSERLFPISSRRLTPIAGKAFPLITCLESAHITSLVRPPEGPICS